MTNHLKYFINNKMSNNDVLNKILQELQSLREEVKELRPLKNEVQQLRKQLNSKPTRREPPTRAPPSKLAPLPPINQKAEKVFIRTQRTNPLRGFDYKTIPSEEGWEFTKINMKRFIKLVWHDTKQKNTKFRLYIQGILQTKVAGGEIIQMPAQISASSSQIHTLDEMREVAENFINKNLDWFEKHEAVSGWILDTQEIVGIQSLRIGVSYKKE